MNIPRWSGSSRVLALALALASALISSLTSAPAAAQGARLETGRSALGAAARQPARGHATDPLERLVTLDARDMPLGDALESINRQADLRLNYAYNVVPVSQRITVSLHDVSAAQALREVLRGTGVTLRSTSDGELTLVRSAQPASQTPTGILIGRVVDSSSGRTLAGVAVTVDGTRLGAITADNGRYRIVNVPAHDVVLTARLIGYRQTHKRVTVRDTGTTEADFVLVTTPAQLSEVVTTGAGERRRVEVGNLIATIDADSVVARMPIRNLSELIDGRVPGVDVVHTDGVIGSSVRMRVRGLRSATRSNEPIVVIDGVRMSNELQNDADANSQGRYDRPSRLDDLDPNLVESIDVLKGPSAAALYGSEAANGVIVIKTKRGKAGPARWNARTDYSRTTVPGEFPTLTQQVGRSLNGNSAYCNLTYQSQGYCVLLDSLVSSNMYRNAQTTPFGVGNEKTYGIDVSGGTPSLLYLLAGSYADRLGPTEMPKQNVRLIEQAQGLSSIPENIRRPNAETNASATGSLTAQLSSTADATLRTILTSRYQRHGDQGIQGVYLQTDTTTFVPGWFGFFHQVDDHIVRSTNALSGNWRPFTWLSAQGSYGYDYTLDDNRDLAQRNTCQPQCGFTNGFPDSIGAIAFGRRTTAVRSANWSGVVTRPLVSALVARSAFGGNYVGTTTSQFIGQAFNLPAGGSSSGSASGQKTLSDTLDDRALAGVYFEQSLEWAERLFVTAGFRKDAGSALGQNTAPVYPKWNVSYLMSNESYFTPLKSLVSEFRLRGAYGHAGIQPGSTSRLRTYSQTVRFIGPDGSLENYASIGNVGNPDLRPERSSELELGADLTALDERVHLEFTRFREVTRDALISRPLAPSLGTTTSRIENLGLVRNKGTEITADLGILRSPEVTWNVNVGYATHHNLLVSLGPGVAPFSLSGSFGGTDDSRAVPGFPLYSRWVRPIVGFYDVNGDGIITSDEIRLGDSLVYIGPPEPQYTMAVSHNVSLLNGRMNVAATFQYTHHQVQVNAYRGALDANSTPGFVKDAASLRDQAYAVAGFMGDLYGYIDNANTLRFSSLGIQFQLPRQFARSLRASNASLSILGSNLGLWTSYRGVDPNVNGTGSSGERDVDTGVLPLSRMWGARLNLNF